MGLCPLRLNCSVPYDYGTKSMSLISSAYLSPQVLPSDSPAGPAMGLLLLASAMILCFLLPPANCQAIQGTCFPCQYAQQTNRQFEQKTDRFWEYDEQSRTWVEAKLPRDLVSCVEGNCTKLGVIKPKERFFDDQSLHQRKRISLTKMSDTSIWVTGESGSIYERFWNGIQWVIAPHDLPVSAGRAAAVFFVNQTILALSEAGHLYQMHLIGENSQPAWIEFPPTIEAENKIKSGAVSHDGAKGYFVTKKGSLLELGEVDPPRWVNHRRPPGANVAEIVDTASLRYGVIFTISLTGELYEFDGSSRPSWKKHVRGDGNNDDTSLMVLRGCVMPGSNSDNSISLFLLSKGGNLIERRLHQRKWKWIAHQIPKDHNLSSITSVHQDEPVDNSHSLFFTTTTGNILEYRKPKHSETRDENWVNHGHPANARAARGISGLQFRPGRILFPLHDGRLGELHLSGKKPITNYIWSVLDAPETEGWNAEYCTEERGPANCIDGIADDNTDGSVVTRTAIRRRKASQMQQEYLLPGSSGSPEYSLPEDQTDTQFRLRVMYGGRSFFLVTDGGVTFEYLYTENVWLWLKHDHSTAIKGAVGSYNGSLFVVDVYGSLFMRERTENNLKWINCTAMRKGKKVIAGAPSDGVEDAIFLIGDNGKLLQFTVSQKKFKWKDCRNPAGTKASSIVDQEKFRKNIVFVVGMNGRLYQYNRVTELWHEHSQSHHLVLSKRPGTAMRPSTVSLAGSVFMLSKDGGLVEYRWNAVEGWNWVEHGTPDKGVALVGSPGPCFQGSQLLLIGSDGVVHLRYTDQAIWRWENLGYPLGNNDVCTNDGRNAAHGNCDPKVAATRPIPFAEDSVIFELRDGRLAEMRKAEGGKWVWSRTIGTPASSCQENYWAALET